MKSILVDMHATKEEEGGGGGGGGGGREWLHKRKEDQVGQPNYLELRLGVSSNVDCTTDAVATSSTRELAQLAQGGGGGGGAAAAAGPKIMFLTTLDGYNRSTTSAAAGGTKKWLPRTTAATAAACGGFVHPWSLAARQQKAAFELAHHISIPSSSTAPRFTAPQTPATVGWPPVGAFRRNLVGKPAAAAAAAAAAAEMGSTEKEAKKSKVSSQEEEEEGDTKSIVLETRPTLFVKVNMEGFKVGRKINLKVHDSYDSLSRALQKMFNNFLSANYCNNSTEEEQDDSPTTDYVLLYEDHEGDRMLVGDVPWEMFITTVRRLYITHNPKAQKCENKKEGNGDAEQ